MTDTITDGPFYVKPIEFLMAALRDTQPQSSWPFWFDGWPHDTEAALLDAIFSGRASYGSATSGVRRVVAAWRAHRGARDDLTSFADIAAEDLIALLGNRQRVSGNHSTKAEAVRDVAAALVSVGIESSGDLLACEPSDLDAAAAAFTSVAGVGQASWSLFVNLPFLGGRGAGRPDAAREVDEHVRAFVRGATNGTDPGEIDRLVSAAARASGVDLATLRHSIWRYQRRSRR